MARWRQNTIVLIPYFPKEVFQRTCMLLVSSANLPFRSSINLLISKVLPGTYTESLTAIRYRESKVSHGFRRNLPTALGCQSQVALCCIPAEISDSPSCNRPCCSYCDNPEPQSCLWPIPPQIMVTCLHNHKASPISLKSTLHTFTRICTRD